MHPTSPGFSRSLDLLEEWPLVVCVWVELPKSDFDIIEILWHADQLLKLHQTLLILVNDHQRLPTGDPVWCKSKLTHIGPECRLFAVKSTSAETGMGVTSRP